jgi:hypothetical protein
MVDGKAQTEQEFWAEDAARLNALAKAAHKAGYQAQSKNRAPPPLNPDGSEKASDKLDGKNT